MKNNDTKLKGIQVRKKDMNVAKICYGTTIEEARIILDEASRCDDNNTKMIIFLGLTCGLRRSEMAGVQIKDIDYEDCSISISHARVAAGHMGDFEKAPKSYNGYRKIYVT